MYDLKIRITTKASSTVVQEGQNILVNGIRLSIDNIRTIVYRLYKTVNARLRKELLFVSVVHLLLEFDIKKLVDNIAELSNSQNFLQDSRNDFPIDGK